MSDIWQNTQTIISVMKSDITMRFRSSCITPSHHTGVPRLHPLTISTSYKISIKQQQHPKDFRTLRTRYRTVKWNGLWPYMILALLDFGHLCIPQYRLHQPRAPMVCGWWYAFWQLSSHGVVNEDNNRTEPRNRGNKNMRPKCRPRS